MRHIITTGLLALMSCVPFTHHAHVNHPACVTYTFSYRSPQTGHGIDTPITLCGTGAPGPMGCLGNALVPNGSFNCVDTGKN